MVNNSPTGTRGILFTLLASVIFFTLIVPAAMGQANVKGQWTTLSLTTPINPVHAALMKNGKVLIVAGSGNCPPSQAGCPTGPPYGPGNSSGAEVFDPVAGTITQLTVPYDMFCNGMVVLPDGRPFINSGSIQYDPFLGALQSAVFDPSTNTFSTVQNMAHGRWYPTLTTLGDGRVMTFSGTDENGNTNTTVEIYTVGTGWSQQYSSGWTPPLYPRMTLLPSGKVFYSGSGTSSALFDPSNTSWTLGVANTIYSGQRSYGTTVLLPLTPANSYDPRVMIMGGNSPATATTEIIDMGAASPKWTSGPAMSQARSQMNAVILPSGKVLAVGGSVNDEDLGSLSLNADLYDPVAKTFSSAGANVYQRLYHSVALLLPDATVWLTGGNPSRGTYEPHMEIYQPAYLFNSSGGLATRPTITSVPSSVSWGNAFTVQTPDAANIASVVLVRPSAVTHSFNMDQRLVGMSFTAGSGMLTVTAPPNGNIAPPGYYMLFLLNSSGVPSVAKFVQLVAGGTNPAPTVSGVAPASGTTAGGTAVQINGTGFLAGATVTFGGTAASNVVVGSSTSITATTPAHAAGAVNVVVTNTDGQSGTSTNGYTYTGGTLGTIAFVQVNSATPANNSSPVSVTYPLAQMAGDLNIVVVGWNDTTSSVSSVVDTRGNSYTLAVGPTSGTGVRQSIYYAKNIVGGSNTVTVTFNQAAFYVDVRVLEYSGLDTTTPLDVTAAAVGTGLSANSGSATTTVSSELIFGAGTTGGSFGTPPSGFVRRILTPDSDIAIDETVSSTGSYSASSTLTYSSTWVMQMAAFKASGQGGTTNPAPTVSGVLPGSGTTAGGTAVQINGTGFLAGATVTFGGTAASNVVVGSSTSITATTPAHAAGAVNVAVTNTDAQSGTLTNGYTYATANPAPTVSGVAPASGTTAGGTAVQINGTGFLAGATVTFGGTAASNVVVGSSTSITATTPAHAAGAVNVVVTNTDAQSGTSTNGYTYTGGTLGTIAFVQVNSATPANNSSPVSVTYPLAQMAGDLNIVVVGWNDTTSSVSSVVDTRGNSYTLAVGPTSGTGVRQSIYYAKNIVGGSNTVTVTFNQAAFYVDVRVLEYSGLDTTTPLNVTAAAVGTGLSANSGSATTTVSSELIFGAGTTGGTFGTVGTGFVRRILTPDSDIAIDETVSSTGSYSASSTLTYSSTWVMQMAAFKASGQGGTTNPAPTVSGVLPGSGTTAGGTAVQINGTGFLAGATVTFGGTAASNVVVGSSTSITATTPAHAAGAVNVAVTNTDAQSGTLTNGYTYATANPAPTVSGVAPASGTTAGGTAVQINGTGFLAGATVTFGGTAASNVVVGSSTSITATTPAHAAGAVNVVVTNTDAQSGTSTNGYTYTGGTLGTIAFVQVNSATPANNSSPVSVTYPLAQMAGDLNIVVVGWNDTTSSVSSVVDTRGNSYTLAVGPTSGTGVRQSIYYAKNIVGGSNTVTVTFNQAAFYVDVRVLEYSGLDTTAPLDVTAGAAGTGYSANSGAATTTAANELIFGAGTTGGTFGTVGTGFVRRILTPDSDIAIDETVSSTGSNSTSSALTYSSTWVMQMATFKAQQ